MIENPPWADRILKTHWAKIQAASPVALLDQGAYLGGTVPKMPLDERGAGRREASAMLGCGHYGCVLKTADERVVLKFTSDPTEAKFITEAMRLDLWPTGIVRYQQILPLEDTHKKRPVFVIWREAARQVGQLFDHTLPGAPIGSQTAYEMRIKNEASRRLTQWLVLGRSAREILKKSPQHLATTKTDSMKQWAWDALDFNDIEESRLDFQMIIPKYLSRFRGAQRLAICIRALHYVAEMGGSEPFMTEVFDALDTYLSEDLLLADVHAGNLGIVDREDYAGGVKVITDPGHLVDLRIS